MVELVSEVDATQKVFSKYANRHFLFGKLNEMKPYSRKRSEFEYLLKISKYLNVKPLRFSKNNSTKTCPPPPKKKCSLFTFSPPEVWPFLFPSPTLQEKILQTLIELLNGGCWWLRFVTKMAKTPLVALTDWRKSTNCFASHEDHAD